MWIYLNGSILQQDEASISPFDRGFLFSDGLYEVIRYYPGYGYFQKEAHLSRLRFGMEQLRIAGVDVGKIGQLADELVRKNEQTGNQAIAYIQVTRGAYIPRQHFFPPSSTQPTVLITTSPFKPHDEEIERGVRVLLEDDIRWSRCDIKTVALIPNVLSRQRAVEAGVTETLWARNGFMTEGTHTNFCAVKDGSLLTPPRSQFILSGVTRNVVLDFCKRMEVEVREREIHRDEIASLDECMIIGTTTEITPVIRVGDISIGDGMPGTITRKLQHEFYKLIDQSTQH